MEQRTPLYDMHVKYHGKMVPFAGYILPVQYDTGVIAEHMAVRNDCGLFDVSHMGEIVCRGADALNNLNGLLTNDYTQMEDGQARYSPMCNENGGVVDDLIVYKIRSQVYLLVVNASNKDKDFAWMRAHQFGDVVFEDLSQGIAQLALQGPKAEIILKKLAGPSDIPEKYYTFRRDSLLGGRRCMISRTGYTGEDGFEIYMDVKDAADVWEMLLEAGKDEGLIPCGLGARDTLRLEAAMPLYGHEMDDTVSPREAGLGIFVKMSKPDFIGKAALEQKGTPNVRRVGLWAVGRGIIREHMAVYDGERQVGVTTSGTHCPYVNHAVAMARIEKAAAEPGKILEVEVRGRRVEAKIVPLPFYKRA